MEISLQSVTCIPDTGVQSWLRNCGWSGYENKRIRNTAFLKRSEWRWNESRPPNRRSMDPHSRSL